ncbi:LAFE_0E03488g1_1 [Lachancea fermentati]|uniref:LAFE_0E03488g1_1 n=1 Tax=Lachancea fermentati TaxID=4955 RepID=A0A1G4MCV1_LACFM|nr:LAFE_0E03488g1_1 [Lachancea fermentati]
MLKQTRTIRPLGFYNEQLQKNPLLVKAITGAVLSATGELISQSTAAASSQRDEKLSTLKEKLKYITSVPKYKKIFMMLLYGGLINAPISHYLYKWITVVTNKHVVAKWRRLAQLCGSWLVVSPIQVFFLVIALTIVNIEQRLSVNKCMTSIKESLKNKYTPMLTSSIVSSTVFVSLAQQLITPEKWSVFLSFAYAGLNTAQNIYMKLAPAKEQAKETEELEKSSEEKEN